MEEEIKEIAKKAKSASTFTAKLSSSIKNQALQKIADELVDNASFLKEENKKDLDRAKKEGLSPAMIDRLTLSDKVIEDMATGLKEVSFLPDPVGEVTKMWRRPNNLLVGKMRIPIGVIGIIYESRPNVTADAAGICLKSGNAVILRGGHEAINSNIAIGKITAKALNSCGIPSDAVQIIPFTSHEAVNIMLKQEDYIDLIIPRGGEGLIRNVVKNSRIPVIKHYKGVCHIFVDEYVSFKMAEDIIVNSKTQRPGVCNALETLLVHKNISKEFLPLIAESLKKKGVEIRGCKKTKNILQDIKDAEESDWYEEYLDLILSIKVVKDIDEAISHILQYGSSHTDAIITQNYNNAQKFLKEVTSSVVLVNASTRFNDGNQLGLGAEIGISTTKLHAFGPMSIYELTTTKFIVYGDGQIRK